jgi:hypothetical protein
MKSTQRSKLKIKSIETNFQSTKTCVTRKFGHVNLKIYDQNVLEIP